MAAGRPLRPSAWPEVDSAAGIAGIACSALPTILFARLPQVTVVAEGEEGAAELYALLGSSDPAAVKISPAAPDTQEASDGKAFSASHLYKASSASLELLRHAPGWD